LSIENDSTTKLFRSLIVGKQSAVLGGESKGASTTSGAKNSFLSTGCDSSSYGRHNLTATNMEGCTETVQKILKS